MIFRILSIWILLSSCVCSGENILLDHLTYGIPQETDLLLSRTGFSIGYSQKYRQAIWVSYILTAEQLEKKQIDRINVFQVDPAVKYHPVLPQNYSGTGYDRGHLAPAADMTYSVETMKYSFFMTNISPQIPGCNRGIWRRVENQVRRWAFKEKSLSVITGPLFKDEGKTLGNTEIPIPYAFYKVILDVTPPMKMIAFLIPNKTTKRRIQSFVVTVDDIEKLTGYDFFSKLPDGMENELESKSDFFIWQLP